MELEATILERLQELRKWQVEQQERLLKQQQEQRDLLSFEQDRMYEALGLSVQGIVLDDSLAGQTQNSPIAEYNTKNHSDNNSNSDISSYKHFEASNEPERPIGSTDMADYERINDQSRIELDVPPLQLNTNRYLNFKSSLESFSPCSEIPVDRQDSVMTMTSSQQTPEKSRTRGSELRMDGVEPLPLDKLATRQIALDDIPVPSPKKDFTTMLEERLRDCAASDDGVDEKNNKNQVKRPFLKKGEGLARFKSNPARNWENRGSRPRSSSLSASMHFSTNIGTKNNTAKLKDTPKSSRTSRHTSKNLVVPQVAQQKSSLKNIAPRKKIVVRSKSTSAVPNRKTSLNPTKNKPEPVDMNISSDIETKNRRELEEMRIFELLEEKAENSSFCSNSSTVLALFRQSTPLKTNNSLTNSGHDSNQPIIGDSFNKHEASDTSLEEIVRSTKTNVPGSPITKIRETVIQKDYLISLPDDNINAIGNRAIATGSYKSMKHTTIQFNNNNNSNNNNNNFKPMIHSDDETEVYESKCRKNVDIGYDENYHERERTENDDRTENERGNVSLHVRFSEYNEYKTIGLTDTSMMSNDSNHPENYIEEKAWSDRSTSPDSSDVEVVFSSGKSKIKLEALPVSLGKKVSTNYGEELTDQTTDEDDAEYSSSCSNDTSYEADNTITETNVERDKCTKMENPASEEESENCNDSGSTIGQENNDKSMSEIVKMDVDGTIFKSELLKTRLLELEREIDIFRKENAALASQRKKLQEEQRQFERELKRKEEDLGKERKSMEVSMLEERKRLGREKAALENRLRDAREKSLQNKQERQEIQILREQLEELREETSQKESRWQAAQARQKSQLRVLQTENSKLKDELEKLRASRTNISRIRRPAASNTRAIHQINKELEGRRKIATKKDSSSDEETTRPRIVQREFRVNQMEKAEIDGTSRFDVDGSKTIVYNSLAQQSTKSDEEPGKKRSLYANLLNEATQDLRGSKEVSLGKHTNGLEKSDEKFAGEGGREDDEERSEGVSSDSISQGNSDNSKLYENIIQNYGTTRSTMEERVSGNSVELSIDRGSHQAQLKEKFSNPPISCTERPAGNSATNKQDIREIRCPDGHTELWYPNGNVKKIYPDRKVTKMIYYNGDVRESAEDGTVKYFYSSTKTWHTTLPDGLEILEFADGQVERRTKNGTTEVSFPDGSVRLLQSDGMEKWVLPDGTVAETFADGNKILSFPNGQREVHTKEHKRREYPDGTMKLVYPDGTQETRYSTGRVRVKDKDGNLIMDVHHR